MDYSLGINAPHRLGLKHIAFKQFHLLTVEMAVAHAEAYSL